MKASAVVIAFVIPLMVSCGGNEGKSFISGLKESTQIYICEQGMSESDNFGKEVMEIDEPVTYEINIPEGYIKQTSKGKDYIFTIDKQSLREELTEETASLGFDVKLTGTGRTFETIIGKEFSTGDIVLVMEDLDYKYSYILRKKEYV